MKLLKITEAPTSAINSQVFNVVSLYRRESALRGHRGLLVLSGECADTLRQTCDNWIQDFSHSTRAEINTSVPQTVCHVPNESNADLADQKQALLGSESYYVIYDATVPFNPGLFAAAAGGLQAGGLFILLTPTWADWVKNNNSRFLVRFTHHLQSVTDTHAGLPALRIGQLESLPSAQPVDSIAVSDGAIPETIQAALDPKTGIKLETQKNVGSWLAEQEQLLDQLLSALTTESTDVVVIQGHRGRGKSALAGRAISILLKSMDATHSTITVTAARQSASDILIKHAKEATSTSQPQTHSLQFQSVDTALKNKHDVLLVEEAGSLPIIVLSRLMEQASRTIFITTVQGYEGAGRAFALRFARLLNKRKPGWLMLEPVKPIRWAADDPLEQFTNTVFLLNAALPETPSHLEIGSSLACRTVDKKRLLDDKDLLTHVYGLLTQAHYQTTPDDLQHLLDKDDMHVFVKMQGEHIVGAALVAIEGNLHEKLHAPIINRQRRLKDQLLPQLLAQVAQNATALSAGYARIVRIAVHPDCQRRGFGSTLVHFIDQHYATQQLSTGASFGADTATLSFWLKQSMTPIHYGLRINPRSGLRAVCMLKAHSEPVMKVLQTANNVFTENLQALNLFDADLDTSLLYQNSIRLNTEAQLPLTDATILLAMSQGSRSCMESAAALRRFALNTKSITTKDQIEAVLNLKLDTTNGQRRKLEASLRTQLVTLLHKG